MCVVGRRLDFSKDGKSNSATEITSIQSESESEWEKLYIFTLFGLFILLFFCGVFHQSGRTIIEDFLPSHQWRWIILLVLESNTLSNLFILLKLLYLLLLFSYKIINYVVNCWINSFFFFFYFFFKNNVLFNNNNNNIINIILFHYYRAIKLDCRLSFVTVVITLLRRLQHTAAYRLIN